MISVRCEVSWDVLFGRLAQSYSRCDCLLPSRGWISDRTQSFLPLQTFDAQLGVLACCLRRARPFPVFVVCVRMAMSH